MFAEDIFGRKFCFAFGDVPGVRSIFYIHCVKRSGSVALALNVLCRIYQLLQIKYYRNEQNLRE